MVVLALSLVACGGSSDEDGVRSASENFVSALKHERWSEVCALMTKKSKDQIEQAGEPTDEKDGCVALWEEAVRRLPSAFKRSLGTFEVDTVKVNGNTATVTSSGARLALRGGQRRPTKLLKEDGEWKVDFAQ